MNKPSEETIKKWKKIGIKILFPHTFLVFLLFNLTVAGLVFIFMNHLEENLLAICFYVIAFYSLVIVCVRIPRMIKSIQRGLHSNKYSHRYLTDRELRMNFSMYRGLIIGIGFAVFKTITGLVYHTPWLYAMAGYNVIMSLMRFVVVFQTQRRGLSEEDKERRANISAWICGWLMMVLNIAVSVIMYMVIVLKQTIEYHEIVVIALAAYTFYCFTMAIINVIKYRKKNLAYSTIKNIDLVKAIVSIFTMQVAMLTRFGTDSTLDMGLMNTLTGVAVTIAINTIAALMLARISKDKGVR